MSERWMRDAIVALHGAIEKFKRGEEGDYKQALVIADNASETIMRHYLVFKCNEKNVPYDYPSLLKATLKKTSVPSDISDTIETFRLIRDGFSHQNINKIGLGLKGTTVGLTLEKSYLEDYLKAVCKLVENLTNVQIHL